MSTNKQHKEYERRQEREREKESDLSYRINFDEPVFDLIERLKREHRQFESKLAVLEAAVIAADTLDPRSMRILEELGKPIVRHAVEEEARILRVIMHNAKEQSGPSIRIAQEHNWIADFIKKTIPKLSLMPQQQAKQEVTQFILDLRNHFLEEEEIMFPLALKASSMQK